MVLGVENQSQTKRLANFAGLFLFFKIVFQTMEENRDFLGIKSWAEEDRPREKLLDKGRQALTDAELIAILIGSGSKNETAVELSKKILASVKNNLNTLGKLTIGELQKFKGIGEAKAISIIAALELGRRRKEIEQEKTQKLTSSQVVYQLLKPIFLDLPHEEFWILLLNRSNHLIKKEMLSRGGVSGTVVDNRLIFKLAIENLASSIIICHNHPSGNLQASEADIKITKSIKESGKLLDITLHDHLIFTDNGFFSFADNGML
jgi:DNA repair protein RadC